MPWNQKENVVREKRTNEATKKELMGAAGKLAIIAKALGSPMMRQGGGLFDVTYIEDPFEDFSDAVFETTASGQNGPMAWRDEILTGEAGGGAGPADEDNPNFQGYVFDGLSRGMHFEVQHHRLIHRIVAYYKGYLVYEELAGDLHAYAPFPEWEDLVAKLYKTAKVKHKEMTGEAHAQFTQELERKKLSFWHRLRMRWGL